MSIDTKQLENARMKKAVPEVRMTEAARKRSAKIRANKETAENKPGSPKFAPRSRVKPMSSRSGTLEKKATGNSMTNVATIEPKKAKIDESAKQRRIVREPLKPTTSTMNPKTNHMTTTTTTMRQTTNNANVVANKKMSSITAAKVKEREEKQQMKDHISRLEREKIVLSERIRVLESKVSKGDILATIVLPNLVSKHDALATEGRVQQERVAEQLAQITTRFTQQIMQLENRVLEHEHQRGRFEAQIRVLNNQLIDQINTTNAQRAINDQQFHQIQERDEIINGFERQLDEVTKENEIRIETEVQERIQPWIEAKAQADSFQIEVEIKNEKNRMLQSQLNTSRQSIEKLVQERDTLRMIAQLAEEKDEKLTKLTFENKQLKDDLETSRTALTAREMEVQDLSFNLEEEKYRTSIGEQKINTSFRAIYDEEMSPSKRLSTHDKCIDEVFN